MTEEEKKEIEKVEKLNLYGLSKNITEEDIKSLETVLNLIQKQQAELEKKDKIINNAINAIEDLRQYFADDLQSDFILILEILKDSKVINS